MSTLPSRMSLSSGNVAACSSGVRLGSSHSKMYSALFWYHQCTDPPSPPQADAHFGGLLPLLARAIVDGDPERDLLHRRRATGAPLDPAVAQDVDGSHLFRH